MILIWVGFIFLEVVFFNYMAWRVRRFLRGYCPKKKMSCIGKYKRNTIDIQQTTRWLLFWLSSLLLDIPFQSFLEADQVLSKESKFLIWTTKGVFLNECFILTQLAIEAPDRKLKLVHPGQFYVRSPILEPRRPWQNTREGKVATMCGAHTQHLQQIVVLGEGCSGRQNGAQGRGKGSENQDQAGCSNWTSSSRAGVVISYSRNFMEPDLPALPEVYDTFSY